MTKQDYFKGFKDAVEYHFNIAAEDAVCHTTHSQEHEPETEYEAGTGDAFLTYNHEDCPVSMDIEVSWDSDGLVTECNYREDEWAEMLQTHNEEGYNLLGLEAKDFHVFFKGQGYID